jgi:hypothetical protein
MGITKAQAEARNHMTKVMFAQARQGYRPGKHAVWDAELGHFRPGPGSCQASLTAYAEWLQVVAGERKHTTEQERRGIINRMLAVEFATKTFTPKPVTPPDQWGALLGESLPARYLARAARAWEVETDGKGTRWAKCAMRSITGCHGRVLYDRANVVPVVGCDECGHNPHGGFPSLHAEATAIMDQAGVTYADLGIKDGELWSPRSAFTRH